MSPSDEFKLMRSTPSFESFRWGGREYVRYSNGDWEERQFGGGMLPVDITRRVEELENKYQDWRSNSGT